LEKKPIKLRKIIAIGFNKSKSDLKLWQIFRIYFSLLFRKLTQWSSTNNLHLAESQNIISKRDLVQLKFRRLIYENKENKLKFEYLNKKK